MTSLPLRGEEGIRKGEKEREGEDMRLPKLSKKMHLRTFSIPSSN